MSEAPNDQDLPPGALNASDIISNYENSPEGSSKILALQEKLTSLAERRVTRVIPVGSKEPPFRAGVISCTHYGSLYEEVAVTKSLYDWFESEGIRVVFHCGDLTEGCQMRKGQEHSIHKHGYDAQLQWTLANYPYKKSIKTYLISGNHDASHVKNGGADICKGVAFHREDISYLGAARGRFVIERPGERDIKIDLLHPDGGSSYALSYKPQKIIEALESGTKPDVMLIGHYHKSFVLPYYRGIAAVLAGCTQRQTDFMARNALAAHIGGHIVEVKNMDGQFMFSSTWKGFHIAQEGLIEDTHYENGLFD